MIRHFFVTNRASSQTGKKKRHVNRFLAYVTALVSLSCRDRDDGLEVVDVVGLENRVADAGGWSWLEDVGRFEAVGPAALVDVEGLTELAEAVYSFTSLTLGCGHMAVRLTLCSAVNDVFTFTHELFSMFTCSM